MPLARHLGAPGAAGAALLALILVSGLVPFTPTASAAEAGAAVDAAVEAQLRARVLALSFSIRAALAVMGVTDPDNASEIQQVLGVNATVAEELAWAAGLDAETVAGMDAAQLRETVAKLEALHEMLVGRVEARAEARARVALEQQLRAAYEMLAMIAERMAEKYNDTVLAQLAVKLRASVEAGNMEEAARIAAQVRARLEVLRARAAAEMLEEAVAKILAEGRVEHLHRLRSHVELLERIIERLPVRLGGVGNASIIGDVAVTASLLSSLNMSLGVVAEAAAAGNATAALEAWAAALRAKLAELEASGVVTTRTLELVNKTIAEALKALEAGNTAEAAARLAAAQRMIAAIEARSIVELMHEFRGRHMMPELKPGKIIMIGDIMRHIMEARERIYFNASSRLEVKLAELITETEAIISVTEAAVANASLDAAARARIEALLSRAQEALAEAKAHYQAALEAKARGDTAAYVAELRLSLTLAVKAHGLARAAAAAAGAAGLGGEIKHAMEKARHMANETLEKMKEAMGKAKGKAHEVINETLGNMTMPWSRDGKGGGGGRHGHGKGHGAGNATVALGFAPSDVEEIAVNVSERVAVVAEALARLEAAGFEVSGCKASLQHIQVLLDNVTLLIAEARRLNETGDVAAAAQRLQLAMNLAVRAVDAEARLEASLAARIEASAKMTLHVSMKLRMAAEARAAEEIAVNGSVSAETRAALEAAGNATIAAKEALRLVKLYRETGSLDALLQAAEKLAEARSLAVKAAGYLGVTLEEVDEAAKSQLESLAARVGELRAELEDAAQAVEILLGSNVSAGYRAALEAQLQLIAEANASLDAAEQLIAEANMSMGVDVNATAYVADVAELLANATSTLKHVHSNIEKIIKDLKRMLEEEARRLQENITRLRGEIETLRAKYAGNETALQLLAEAEAKLDTAESNITAALQLLHSLHGNTSLSAKAEIVVEASIRIETAAGEVEAAATIVAELEASAEASAQPPQPPGMPGGPHG